AWRVWLWSKRNKAWAAAMALALLGCLSLGVYVDEQRRHAEERAQAKERQLQLLEVQRIRQGDHPYKWSQTVWNRIAGMEWIPEERGAVQAQAVGARTGLATRPEKASRIHAQRLASPPDGRLGMGHTRARLEP